MAVEQQPTWCRSLYDLRKTSTSPHCFSPPASSKFPLSPSSSPSALWWRRRRNGAGETAAVFRVGGGGGRHVGRRRELAVRSSADSGSGGRLLPAAASGVSLSDVFWPSAGAFAAMAILGKLDQMMAPRGLSLTIAPLGAVSAVLFASPDAPAARKYNMFVAQVGCAAFGVLALSIFGPGWLARGAALSASIAFMIITGAIHPPAASLPLLFIDSVKFHRLHLWYALFPGAAGCLILCLIQEMVTYLKNNFKF